MSDLTSLFRDEMLERQSFRCAGDIVNRKAASHWLLISLYLVALGIAFAWSITVTYSTGRDVTGFIRHVNIPERVIEVDLPVKAIAFLHERSLVEISIPTKMLHGVVTAVSFGQRNVRHYDSVSINENTVKVRIDFTEHIGASFSLGQQVKIKSIIETKSVFEWATGF